MPFQHGIQAVHQREITLGNDDPLAEGSTRSPTLVRKRRGKYIEIPHVLDGFFMLNKAPADDPENVYHLDVSSHQLRHVIEDDLTMFTNLASLQCGENELPFAKLGVLPELRRLVMPCNSVQDLDLEVEGRFLLCEEIDLSYNALTHAGVIVLATLPNLRRLDLSSNNLRSLPVEIADMIRWRDRVIERILPKYQLDALETGFLEGNVAQHATPPPETTTKEQTDSSIEVSSEAAAIPAPMDTTGAAEPAADESAPVNTSSSDQDQQQQSPQESGMHRPSTQERLTVAEDGALTVTLDNMDEGSIESLVEGEEKQQEELADVPMDSEERQEQLEQCEPPDDVERQEREPGDDVPVQNPQSDPPVIAEQIEAPATVPVEQSHSSEPPGDFQAAPVPDTVPPPEQREEHEQPVIVETPFVLTRPPFPVESPGGAGFKKLEVLILENNDLNTPDAFKILGALPNLRILDLTRNRIHTLSFLSHPTSQDDDQHTQQQHKYDGFYTLEELHLTHNLISTVEDLMGIVRLPRLEKVYLAGNPVMKRAAAGRLEIKEDGGEVLGYVAFNPLKDLPALYNITVADPIYHATLAPLPLLPTQPTLAKLKNPIKKPSASSFLSHIHRKNAPPAIQPGHNVAPHTVSEVHTPLSAFATRRMRRGYRYTEEDVKKIIRRGRIPDIGELVEMSGRRERGTESDDEQDEEADISSNVEESPPEFQSSEHVLHYDPSANDPTFLTGVHITSTSNPQLPFSSSHLSFQSTSSPPEYPDSADSEPDEDTSYLFPNTISASLRALRYALTSPSSYWRAIEKPYEHHTFSSIRKHAQRHRKITALTSPKKSMGRWRGNEEATQEVRAQGVQGLIPGLDTASVEGQNPLPRLHTPSAITSMQKYRAARKWRPKDEFAEMREVMERVDERIKVVEANLATLLKTPAPTGHLKLIPQSRKLLQEVQHEYDRIERMYNVAAIVSGNDSEQREDTDDHAEITMDSAIKAEG
ncbi:hypothetical protein SpCBS45565_g00525 [Spizellomyces sp. 'palustris']|nr:hypothetical protein SpCBS45565_g00525 [Spizellomyces sp. 'palustris']